MGETASSADTTVLRVKNLSGPLLHGVSFELREGEILGVTGLLGSGQTDLCHALFGLESASSGLILIRGQPHTIRNPQDAMAAGIAYVPEDRLTEGLFLTQSVERNLVAARLDPVRDRRGWIRPAAITRHVDEWLAKLDIQAASGRMPVNALSGGNQQRVLLARWLATCPDILILNGPTVGVDVGSKEGIHRKLRALASEGMGIMMISDDLPELTQNCVRVLVMQEGRIVHEWKRGEDPDQLGRHLTSFACET
jgi:simple sugar transport system ATP-binding protein